MLLTWQHLIHRNLFMSNKNQMHQHNQGSHHDQLLQEYVYGQMRVRVYLMFMKFPYNLTSLKNGRKRSSIYALPREEKRVNKGKKWLEICLYPLAAARDLSTSTVSEKRCSTSSFKRSQRSYPSLSLKSFYHMLMAG